MERWDRSRVLDEIRRYPGKKVALVSGTLNSLALISLFSDFSDVTVLYIDAWIDFPWVRSYLLSRVPRLSNGRVVTPRPPYLFFEYLLAKGYPPPRETFRWHTRRVRVEPLHDFMRREGYDVIILDTTLYDLPEHKRVSFFPTVRNGVGFARQKGTDFPVLFPLAGVSRSDIVDLAYELNDSGVVSLLVSAPRANCWLCDFPESDYHAEVALSYGFFGVEDVVQFRDHYIRASRRPENRIVDEHGYPRSLTLEFRRWFYSAYQSLASRLNRRVPGYFPLLPASDRFGL